MSTQTPLIEYQLGDLKAEFEEFKKDTKLEDAEMHVSILELQKQRDTTNYPEVVSNEKEDHRYIGKIQSEWEVLKAEHKLDHDWILLFQETWKIYKNMWKVYLTIAAFVGGLIGYIIKTLLDAKILFH